MPKKLLSSASALFFLAFVYFSYLVAKGHFIHLDFDTTVKLQDHLSHKFDFPFSLFSFFGSVEISGFFWLGLVIFLLFKRFLLAALSLLLLPLSLAIELFSKIFVYHPGPPHLFYRGVIHFNLPSEYVAVEYSYPSGHLTRASFLVAFLICYFYFQKLPYRSFLTFLLLGFLALMFVSRIYLGEHWLSDVLGGFLIGNSFGLLAGLTLPQPKNVT